VQVKGVGGAGTLTGILAIGAGHEHACAVRADRSTVCWGANTTGQLGNGTTTDSTAPVVVLGTGGGGTLGSVAAVDGGEGSTCARLTDLTARCWGANSQGQLGDNSTTQRLWPVQVKGVGGLGSLTSVSRLRVGAQHACAVNSSNVLRCWGDNDSGQLGIGSTTDALAPATVASPLNGDASTGSGGMGAGSQHTCSLRTTGATWCWGTNVWGQLGDGTQSAATSPVPVSPA
jgi:alpha-tubulin suppressor-like RCC1 family protein